MAEKNSEIKLNLIEPRATEKTYNEQTKRFYVFPVERNMTKQAIAKMVEEEFKVTVTDVKTLIRKGKPTRYSRGKRAYPGTTFRQDKKYAYVRLKAGDSIKVFEDQEDTAQETTKADKKAKTDKKAEKVAKDTKAKADKKAGKENK